MAYPTVLYVEDRPEIREDTAQRLEKSGARVIVASNLSEGLDRFQRNASVVSALLTDVRLNDSADGDQSGVVLSDRVGAIVPDLPRFGVTAFELTERGHGFRAVYAKKFERDEKKFNAFLTKIVKSAVDFDQSRYAETPHNLLLLKSKYGITDQDFFTLFAGRRISDISQLALLSWHDIQGTIGDDHDDTAVDGHRKIRIICAGVAVRNELLKCDVPVVIRFVGDTFISELFGAPLVFAYADSEEEAVSNLLEHLLDCFNEMNDANLFTSDLFHLDILRFNCLLRRMFANDNGLRNLAQFSDEGRVASDSNEEL